MLSSFMTSSRARTDFSRPTKSGTIMCGKTTISRSGRTGSAVVDDTVIGNTLHKNGPQQQQGSSCLFIRWGHDDRLSTIETNKEAKELCALFCPLGKFGMNYQRSGTVTHYISIDYHLFNVSRCRYIKQVTIRVSNYFI